MSEKTAEGVQPTGQKPDAAAKRMNLRESDPQAYETFLDELREVAGIPQHEGKTLEEIVFALAQRNIEEDTPSADLDRRAETISLPTALRGFLERLIQQADTPQERAKGDTIAELGDRVTRAEERIRLWRNKLIDLGWLNPVDGEMISPFNQPSPAPALPPQGKPNPVSAFIDQLIAGSDMSGPSAFDILKVCMELAIFLIDKNRKYGDSALDPVRIMSSADPLEQIKVRIDDKLSRLMRGQTGGEDAMQDLVGYWILMRVAERRQADKEA